MGGRTSSNKVNYCSFRVIPYGTKVFISYNGYMFKVLCRYLRIASSCCYWPSSVGSFTAFLIKRPTALSCSQTPSGVAEQSR